MAGMTHLIPRRPVGPFRGSVLGFLGGVCTVSAFGFYTLFDKYTTASSLLLQSVEELKQSSVELQHYAQRLERVEARCKKLEDTAATRAEVQRIAAENKALYTELNLSLLEAKKNIWGLEGDVQLLLADRARVVRIQ